MKIPIFLSYPKPINENQQNFINRLNEFLVSQNYYPMTLGVNEYDIYEPLLAIRKLMISSNGIITIALKKNNVSKLTIHKNSTIQTFDNIYFTSPWCQIETAMAYQLGIPIMILREKDVFEEGILEKGISGIYLPEFDLNSNIENYISSEEFLEIFKKWGYNVTTTINNKSKNKLY